MIEMYLGMHDVGWAIEGCTQAWSAHDDPVAALVATAVEIERLRASRWRKARVNLWLSGGLARPFLCGPVAGLAGWVEAEAMAAAMALEATGFNAPCRVRLEGWPGDDLVLCTAVDTAVADAIAEVARSRRLVWRSVRPRWAGLLDEVLTRHASVSLIACAEPDALTILGGVPSGTEGRAGEFELTATHSPGPAVERSLALWNRMVLSRDVRQEDAWFAQVETPGARLGQAVEDSGTRRCWPGALWQPEAVLA